MKTQILVIDYDRYLYDSRFNSLDSFIEYVNQSNQKFIPMTSLLVENCNDPFYIKEETKINYINFDNVTTITEEEVTLLSKSDYEAKLNEIVSKLCVTCSNYTEDSEGDNLKGHREKLCLDGTCPYYEKQD